MVCAAGCATSRNQKDLEIQGLRNRMSVLETELEDKDEEISSLREALAGAQAQKKVIGEAKSRFTVKQAQIALQNAGYDPGPIDGKMGKKTKAAIIAFQRDNNLNTTGKADNKTWDSLKRYLYKKVK